MKVRPIKLLILFSFLLCMLTHALWLDSYFHSRRVIRYNEKGDTMVCSDSGKVALQTTRGGPGYHPGIWRFEAGPARIWGGAHLTPAPYGRFGFGHVRVEYIVTVKYTVHQTWIPFWSIAIITAVLPAVWSIRRGNRKLRRYLATRRALLAGLCPICNYDLRATPTLCPECGHTPD